MEIYFAYGISRIIYGIITWDQFPGIVPHQSQNLASGLLTLPQPVHRSKFPLSCGVGGKSNCLSPSGFV